MKGVSVLFVLALCTSWVRAQFLNNRPYPTYSLEDMPKTEFSCRDKILGGYYADPQTECQMFHICVKVAGVGIQDFRFLCPNSTAFDQDHQICADWEDVDCDATTLYYSSDNFDLYRIGSGFESKAVKYGEDEETFALQRAETGDARLNRDHQSSSVNQKQEPQNFKSNRQKQHTYNSNTNNNNNDREIFKGSSSSNFYNNRNNGKEKDEDYDDNVNANQYRDNEQKRKASRVSNQRRPVQRNQNRNRNDEEDTQGEAQTKRPSTFVNNFAGSSYAPTTSRTTVGNNYETSAATNYRGRNGQRRQQTDSSPASPSTAYTESTPAPSRQTYNTVPVRQSTQNTDNGRYYTTTQAPRRDTEIYTPSKSKQTTPYDDQYNTPRVKSTKTENYPTTASKNYDQYDVPKKSTPYGKTENYPSNNPLYQEKKPTTPVKQAENYPTTFSPRPKPFTASSQPPSNFPTTFAPRTNAGFTQIIQQTEQYNDKQPSAPQQKSTVQFSSSGTNQQYNSPTPKSTPFTQYTPTVPKISSTTPVSRSNRYDETQYDDGSYNDKKEDEFLKTAHSQNIAASRNEFAKTTKQQQSTATPQFESPRPFSVSVNTQKTTNTPQATSPVRVTSPPRTNAPKVEVAKTTPTEDVRRSTVKTPTGKKVKDASYDYAYYDSYPSSEPEYDIDTDLKKSTVKN